MPRLVFLALLGVILLGSSGCTAIFAAAGAVVDSVVITSPLWGPSVFERNKLDRVQRQSSLPPDGLEGPGAFAANSTLSPHDSLHVGVRLFEGAESPREPRYFSWLSAVPVLPYTRTNSIVTQSRATAVTQDYISMGNRGMVVTFPLARIPEPMRPGQDPADMTPPCRETIENLVRGEMASRSPTAEELADSLWAVHRDKAAFQLTFSAQKALENQFGKHKALFEMPELAGCYRFPGFLNKPPAFVLKDDIAITLLPNEFQIVGRTLGYPEIARPHVSVSGRVVDLRIEKSQICYGLTLIGTNLLGWLGAPLSSNRLVIKFHVTAHQKPGNELLLFREYELATPRKVIGIYYGGDFADDAYSNLHAQITDSMRDFARELAILAPLRGLTASIPSGTQTAIHKQ
jgi:hypothetical protein